MLPMYLGVLDKFLADLIPLALGWLALRRFVLSRSFNRVIYLAVLLHCIAVLFVAAQAQEGDWVLREFAHMLAYSPVFLWIGVLHVTDSTRMAPRYSRPYQPVFRTSREGALAGH